MTGHLENGWAGIGYYPYPSAMNFRTIDVHRDVAGFRNFTSVFMSSVKVSRAVVAST